MIMQRAIVIPIRSVLRSNLCRSSNTTSIKCLSTKQFLNKNNSDGSPPSDPTKDKAFANFEVDDVLLETARENSLNTFSDHQNPNQPSFNMDEMILNSSNLGDKGQNDFFVEDDVMNDDDISAEILNVAIEFVPQYGWSDRAIEEAVKTLELSPSSSGMFKRGAVDLVLHFIEQCNNDLTDHMADVSRNIKQDNQGKSQFIEDAIQTRLKMIIPYIDSWPQALTLLVSPSAAADCLENGANMVDEIWYHAGDLSMDMSWYTKRAALAAVYAATELYMLRDNSVEYQDTWDFLHRRLEDFKAAEIAKSSVAHSMTDFYALASAGFTTAQNVLGINRKYR